MLGSLFLQLIKSRFTGKTYDKPSNLGAPGYPIWPICRQAHLETMVKPSETLQIFQDVWGKAGLDKRVPWKGQYSFVMGPITGGV